jgi:two-component system, cell cycle sensor histidine kinase and response regulator CckA
VEREITEVLALGLTFLSEAVLLTETKSGLEQVIFVNQAFERLSGYSLQELRGLGLTLLQGPETDSQALRRLLHSPDAEGAESLDVLLYKKDKTLFWDRIKVSKVETANRVFRLQVHSDVTHHKEIEERFILAQKREATSHLMSGLAHDFNNLLTAILVYSGLMAPKVKGDAQLQRYVDEVHNSAQRASQLVAQLLTLGRETGEPEMVDLHELMEENSDLLKRVLGEDIRLNLEADPNLKEVRAHPGRIQQVLLNLAINARDAMPGGGELLIHLSNQSPDDAPPSSPRTYVLLLVRDTGAGMDSETLANIFKPFFSTKGKDEGTGLGLFVVRTIVEQYDGRISVESEPGKGTSFKILLPAVSNAGN